MNEQFDTRASSKCIDQCVCFKIPSSLYKFNTKLYQNFENEKQLLKNLKKSSKNYFYILIQ